MRRLLPALPASVLALLLLAPAALAQQSDHGEGWYGETDDVVITNAGFIVIAFFPLFVAFMSFVQWRLEKRKEARKKAAKEREARPEWRAGW